MNKIERVQAALQGKKADRVPASFWFHFPAGKAAGEPMAQIHLDYYRRSNVDFLKVMNDNGYTTPDGAASGLTDPEQWANLQPTPLSAECFQNQLSGLKTICDALKDECMIITTIFCPYATANGLSDHTITDLIKKNPEAAKKGLMAIAESLAEFAKACVHAGASGIYFSAQGGDKDRFTDEEFNEIIKPADVKVLSAVNDASFNLLHICGADLNLDRYADYPGTAVNWATQLGNPSLTEGKAIFNRTIVGGIDQRGPMIGDDKEAMKAEVDAALKEGGELGFILGAGCTLPNEVNWDNIRFVMDYLNGK